MKPDLRDLFCKPGGLARNCFPIPDDDSCKAAFDAAWPECTHDIVLHAGPSEADHEAGIRAGKCIGKSIGTKFPASGSPACKN